MDAPSESDLILPFLLPARRVRWAELFSKPKGRKRLMDSLWHGRDIDPKFLVPIHPNRANPHDVAAMLRRLGSSEQCHVLSVRRDLDGKDLDLHLALEQVVGVAPGTVVSCLPGKLAYYERDEKNGRYLLMKK
jgi:hypothetical protein